MIRKKLISIIPVSDLITLPMQNNNRRRVHLIPQLLRHTIDQLRKLQHCISVSLIMRCQFILVKFLNELLIVSKYIIVGFIHSDTARKNVHQS